MGLRHVPDAVTAGGYCAANWGEWQTKDKWIRATTQG